MEQREKNAQKLVEYVRQNSPVHYDNMSEFGIKVGFTHNQITAHHVQRQEKLGRISVDRIAKVVTYNDVLPTESDIMAENIVLKRQAALLEFKLAKVQSNLIHILEGLTY